MRIARPVLLVWTLLNILISVALVGAWWLGRPAQTKVVAVEAAAVPALPAGDVHFLPPDQPRDVLTVVFPTAVAEPAALLRAAPAELLRLTPEVAGVLRFRAVDRLEFLPDKDWPLATRVTAVLNPDQPTVDGRCVGAQSAAFVANPLRILGVSEISAEFDQADTHVLQLTFNQAVSARAVQTALSVSDDWSIGRVGVGPFPRNGDANGDPWADFPTTDFPSSENTSLENSSPENSSPGKELAPTKPADVSGKTLWLTVRIGKEGEEVRNQSTWLRCAGSLSPAAGGEAIGKEWEKRLVFTDEVALTEVRAVEGGILLSCPKQLALPEVDQAVGLATGIVTLTPARTVTWERRYNGLLARCTVTPGEVIRVQAQAGFPGRGRFRLAAAIDDVVRVGDAPESVAFTSSGSVLSAAALPIISVEAMNIDAVQCGLRRVYDNNLVRFSERDWRVGDAACTPWRQQSQPIPMNGTRNVRSTVSVDLRAIWDEPVLPPGWYEMKVAGLRAGELRDLASTFIQVSDIACAVRSDSGDLALRVWSLADGIAAPDVEVQVLSPTNQPLVQGRTDAAGLCVLQHRNRDPDQTPFVVILTRGNDRLAIDLRRFRMELVAGDLAGENDPMDGRLGWLWSERGLVRPGEAVRVAGMIRNEAGLAAVGEAVALRLWDPGQRLVQTWNLTVPSDGMLTQEFQLPAAAPQGTWRWELWLPGSGLALGGQRMGGDAGRRLADAWTRVETFVPDRIQADATLGPQIAPGFIADAADLHVAATVHATTGEAVAGAIIEARWRIAAATVSPPGQDGFGFGLTAGTAAEVPPGVIAAQRFATTADGSGRWALRLPPLPGTQAVHVAIDGSAMESGGRALPIAAAATVVTVPILRGVRAAVDATGQLELGVIRCTADGSAVDSAALPPLTVIVERRQWVWDLVEKGRSRQWRTTIRREEITRQPLIPGAVATLPNPEAGAGWLVALVAEDGVVWAEHVVGGHVPARPDRLRVSALGPVAAGGEATLRIVSPLAGQALLTVEGQGIHGVRVIDLIPGENMLTVPVPATVTRPNLHVVVVLATAQRGHGDGALWMAGATPLIIARSDRDIPLTLNVPAEASPEQPLSMYIQAPGARRAFVVAVDEAVLLRTRHAVPDPAARFRTRRALSGQGATSMADLMDAPQWPEQAGGDGDEDDPFLAALSQRSADLDHLGAFARWQEVELDAQGNAEVTWPLGDFEGRLRVVAIVGSARACGAAHATSLIRAPLGIRVSVPRVLAPGDTVAAVVTLSARAHDGSATVTIDGGAAFTIGTIPDVGELTVGVPVSISVPVTAKTTDPAAVVTVSAQVHGADAALTQRTTTVHLPVRPAARWVEEQYVVEVGADAGAEITWQPPGEWSGPLTVHLEAARDHRDQLRGAVATMLAYPHGCGEQIASQLVVLVACQDLVRGDDAVARTRSLLAHGVAQLRNLDTGEGFSWWPGERTADPWVTVHAVGALLAAEEAGNAMTPGERHDWLDAVEEVVRRDERLVLRCQGVAVLAQGGRSVTQWVDVLAERSNGLEARAWLALASARAGDRVRAAQLIQGADPSTAVLVRDVTSELQSPLRCAALELGAWLATDPAQARVAILAERLFAAVRRPTKMTTQELATVLPVLNTWCAIQPADRQSGLVTIDGVEMDGTKGWDRTLDADEQLRLAAPQATWVVIGVSGWRRDAGGPNAEGVRLSRHWRSLETGIIVESMQAGHAYAVELQIETTRPLPSGVLTDLLPAGVEYDATAVTAMKGDLGSGGWSMTRGPVRVLDPHDDRVLLVLNPVSVGTHRITYPVRALLPGISQAGAPALEAFYDPSIAVAGTDAVVTVLP